MRVALISDIHGGAFALEAVLKDIANVGADQIVCLGDVATLGPQPVESMSRIRDLGCPCVMGNHDEFLINEALIRAYTEAGIIVDAVDWCRDKLSSADLEFLRSFQPTLTLDTPTGSPLLLFHGTPRSHMENLLATTAPEALDEMLADQTAIVMAGGHTHIQMLRQHRGTLIINPGSVGMPFVEFTGGGPPRLMAHAEYGILTLDGDAVSIDLRRVPLDKSKLRAAADACDSPMRGMLLSQYR